MAYQAQPKSKYPSNISKQILTSGSKDYAFRLKGIMSERSTSPSRLTMNVRGKYVGYNFWCNHKDNNDIVKGSINHSTFRAILNSIKYLATFSAKAISDEFKGKIEIRFDLWEPRKGAAPAANGKYIVLSRTPSLISMGFGSESSEFPFTEFEFMSDGNYSIGENEFPKDFETKLIAKAWVSNMEAFIISEFSKMKVTDSSSDENEGGGKPTKQSFQPADTEDNYDDF